MILHWNIRGLQANREELDLLFSNLDPTVICIQETFLKENKTINFKHYSSYHRYASEANGIVHGDLVFLLNHQHHTDKLNFKLACRPLLFVLLWVEPSPYVPFTFPLQWFLILQILKISLLNSLPHPTAWGP